MRAARTTAACAPRGFSHASSLALSCGHPDEEATYSKAYGENSPADGLIADMGTAYAPLPRRFADHCQTRPSTTALDDLTSFALHWISKACACRPCASPRAVDAPLAAVQWSGMTATTTTLASTAHRPLLPILLALSGAHLLNDLIQSMIPAMYPLLKEAYRLDFMQIGLITLAFQVTSSLLQPVLGFVTDHKPWPYAMVAGMASTLAGLIGLAFARQLRDGARLGGAGRARLGGVPSGGDAHGAPRRGRPAGLCAGHIPDRRARRIRDRAAARGDDRGAARAGKPRLGVRGGAGRRWR